MIKYHAVRLRQADWVHPPELVRGSDSDPSREEVILLDEVRAVPFGSNVSADRTGEVRIAALQAEIVLARFEFVANRRVCRIVRPRIEKDRLPGMCY